MPELQSQKHHIGKPLTSRRRGSYNTTPHVKAMIGTLFRAPSRPSGNRISANDASAT
ncbi:hypothetical protein SAM23877_4056 [Streptomyces ambofaciens ATCC 23877]|uniref:Uncharacterized protein n=1 Tax=Streptomyces ambofaciens (strain ATCC 23877 / 3486 / DSM 40053 / JCM 4204 / NBRC 12836 / NRRL B-2516) TaxID=278992 RepID=A0A0K2AW27_STRA7|nr:hypothetical protein SAM23877_4056 [Streptomyces ambofaciens ATCC 23877]